GMSGFTYLELIRDSNGNGVVDSGEVIAASNIDTQDKELTATVFAAGDYFVHVLGFSGNTDYTLRLTPDYAGSTLGTARNIGTVPGPHSARDFVGTSPSDTDDFFRFSLPAAGRLGVTMYTPGIDNPNGPDADLQLIRDANNNGVVDAGEVLAA